MGGRAVVGSKSVAASTLSDERGGAVDDGAAASAVSAASVLREGCSGGMRTVSASASRTERRVRWADEAALEEMKDRLAYSEASGTEGTVRWVGILDRSGSEESTLEEMGKGMGDGESEGRMEERTWSEMTTQSTVSAASVSMEERSSGMMAVSAASASGTEGMFRLVAIEDRSDSEESALEEMRKGIGDGETEGRTRKGPCGKGLFGRRRPQRAFGWKGARVG